jgi:hypothetical protein
MSIEQGLEIGRPAIDRASRLATVSYILGKHP